MTLRILTAVVAVWAFAYLVGAFVAARWNPERWDYPGRLIAVVLACFLTVAAINIALGYRP